MDHGRREGRVFPLFLALLSPHLSHSHSSSLAGRIGMTATTDSVRWRGEGESSHLSLSRSLDMGPSNGCASSGAAWYTRALCAAAENTSSAVSVSAPFGIVSIVRPRERMRMSTMSAQTFSPIREDALLLRAQLIGMSERHRIFIHRNEKICGRRIIFSE